jgi:hypothetical protein
MCSDERRKRPYIGLSSVERPSSLPAQPISAIGPCACSAQDSPDPFGMPRITSRQLEQAGLLSGCSYVVLHRRRPCRRSANQYCTRSERCFASGTVALRTRHCLSAGLNWSTIWMSRSRSVSARSRKARPQTKSLRGWFGRCHGSSQALAGETSEPCAKA